MSEMKNKKKSRAGHKGYLTQGLEEVDACLENYRRKENLKSSNGRIYSKNNEKNS